MYEGKSQYEKLRGRSIQLQSASLSLLCSSEEDENEVTSSHPSEGNFGEEEDVEHVPGTPEEATLLVVQPAIKGYVPSHLPEAVAAPGLQPESAQLSLNGLHAQHKPHSTPPGSSKEAPACSQSRKTLMPTALKSSQGARPSSAKTRLTHHQGPARAPTPPLALQLSSSSPQKQQQQQQQGNFHASPPHSTRDRQQQSSSLLQSNGSLVGPANRPLVLDSPRPGERSMLPLTSSPILEHCSAPLAANRGQKGALPLTRSPSPNVELLAGALVTAGAVVTATPSASLVPQCMPALQLPADRPALMALPHSSVLSAAVPPQPLPSRQQEQQVSAVAMEKGVGAPGLLTTQLQKHVSMTVEDKMDLWNASRAGTTPCGLTHGPLDATPIRHPLAAPAAPQITNAAGAAAISMPGPAFAAKAGTDAAAIVVNSTPQAGMKKAPKESTSAGSTPYDDAMFSALESIERRYHQEQIRAGQGAEGTEQHQQHQGQADYQQPQQPMVYPPPPQQQHTEQQQVLQPQHQQEQQLLNQQQSDALHPPPVPRQQSYHQQHQLNHQQQQQPIVLYPPPPSPPQLLQQQKHQRQPDRLSMAMHWLNASAPILPSCALPPPTNQARSNTARLGPEHVSLPANSDLGHQDSSDTAAATAAPILKPPSASSSSPFQFPIPPAPVRQLTSGPPSSPHSQPPGIPSGAAVFQPWLAQQSHRCRGSEPRHSIPFFTQLGSLANGHRSSMQPLSSTRPSAEIHTAPRSSVPPSSRSTPMSAGFWSALENVLEDPYEQAKLQEGVNACVGQQPIHQQQAQQSRQKHQQAAQDHHDHAGGAQPGQSTDTEAIATPVQQAGTHAPATAKLAPGPEPSPLPIKHLNFAAMVGHAQQQHPRSSPPGLEPQQQVQQQFYLREQCQQPQHQPHSSDQEQRHQGTGHSAGTSLQQHHAPFAYSHEHALLLQNQPQQQEAVEQALHASPKPTPPSLHMPATAAVAFPTTELPRDPAPHTDTNAHSLIATPAKPPPLIPRAAAPLGTPPVHLAGQRVQCAPSSQSLMFQAGPCSTPMLLPMHAAPVAQLHDLSNTAHNVGNQAVLQAEHSQQVTAGGQANCEAAPASPAQDRLVIGRTLQFAATTHGSAVASPVSIDQGPQPELPLQPQGAFTSAYAANAGTHPGQGQRAAGAQPLHDAANAHPANGAALPDQVQQFAHTQPLQQAEAGSVVNSNQGQQTMPSLCVPAEDLYDDEDDLGMMAGGEPLGGQSQHANQARLNLMTSCSQFGSGSRSTPAIAHLGAGVSSQHQHGSFDVPLRGSSIAPSSLSLAITTQGTDGTGNSCACQFYRLDDYLPADVVQVYREQFGMTRNLYDWQVQALGPHLDKPRVLQGCNFVFSAPTSAGKTIVYEILALRRLISTNKPFMLVLPTVVLCQQKAEALDLLLASGSINKKVKRFFGGVNSRGAYIEKDTGALVCTIEKANQLVGRMMEEQSLGELGALVVDELHMVADDDRGYLLELLLTKLRFSTATMETSTDANGETEEDDLSLREDVQVIGMSATMPNVAQVAQWLGARLYVTDFRPVPLAEYIKDGRNLWDPRKAALVRILEPPSDSWAKSDPDLVALLAKETTDAGHSILVFCPSKKDCEWVGQLIANHLGQVAEKGTPSKGSSASPAGCEIDLMPGFLANATPQLQSFAPGSRAATMHGLNQIMGVHPVLPGLVSKGVAFHHAGLSTEERQLVEAAYNSGAVSVLCCTSTMAVGVNLPARRVVFYKPYIGLRDNPIDVAQYRQMAGRAGRAGIDEAGESIIISQPGFGPYSTASLSRLILEPAAPITTCLVEQKRGMKRALLEAVASGAVSSGGDIQMFIGSTLLFCVEGYEVAANATMAALKWLNSSGFIILDKAAGSEGSWLATPMGKATLASTMDPGDALLVRSDLQRAREQFVMSTELHLTYLVVPANNYDITPDWKRFQDILFSLKVPDKRVMGLVGVKEGYVNNRMQGKVNKRALENEKKEDERLARKFFVALVLHEVINEIPMDTVAAKYGLNRSIISRLQENATKAAGMVSSFCNQMNWSDLEHLIAKFQGRINTAVRSDIVELTGIPGVKGYRARVLYKAGLKTPEDVAACHVDKLTEILVAASLGSKNMTEQQKHNNERRAARMIHQGANVYCNAKASSLQTEAMELLELQRRNQEAHTSRQHDSLGTHSEKTGSPASKSSPGTAIVHGGAPHSNSALHTPQQHTGSKKKSPARNGAKHHKLQGPGPSVDKGAGGWDGAPASSGKKRGRARLGDQSPQAVKRVQVEQGRGDQHVQQQEQGQHSQHLLHHQEQQQQQQQHQQSEPLHFQNHNGQQQQNQQHQVSPTMQHGLMQQLEQQSQLQPPHQEQGQLLKPQGQLLHQSGQLQVPQLQVQLEVPQQQAQPQPSGLPQQHDQPQPAQPQAQVQHSHQGQMQLKQQPPQPYTHFVLNPPPHQQPSVHAFEQPQHQHSVAQLEGPLPQGQQQRQHHQKHEEQQQQQQHQWQEQQPQQQNQQHPCSVLPQRRPRGEPAGADQHAGYCSMPPSKRRDIEETSSHNPGEHHQQQPNLLSATDQPHQEQLGRSGTLPEPAQQQQWQQRQPQQHIAQPKQPGLQDQQHQQQDLKLPMPNLPPHPHPPQQDPQKQQQPPKPEVADVPLVPPEPSNQQQGATLIRTPAELRALHAKLKRAGHFSFQLLFASNKAASVVLPNPHKKSDTHTDRGSGKGTERAGSEGAESGCERTGGGRAFHGSGSAIRGTLAVSGGAASLQEGAMGEVLATLVEGAAVCCGDGGCYYIELQPGDVASAAGIKSVAGTRVGSTGAPRNWQALTSGAEAEAQQGMVALMRAVLMDEDVTKVTFRLKEQLYMLEMNLQHLRRMLHAPGPLAPQLENGSEATTVFSEPQDTAFEVYTAANAHFGRAGGLAAAVESSLSFKGPLVDVLLAVWILEPDSKLVSEFSSEGRSGKKACSKVLEELLQQRVGKAPVKDALQRIVPTTVTPSGYLPHLAIPLTGGIPPTKNSGGSLPNTTPPWCCMRRMELLRQAVLSCKLYERLQTELQSSGLMAPLLDIEMPLVHVLARMEAVGVDLDIHSLLVQRLPLRRWLSKLEHRAYKYAGQQLILGSAQQVSHLLYKTLKIPVPTSASKYKSGDHSVSKDDLEEIKDAHPVVPIIMEHRRISKQLSLLQGLVDQVCLVDAHAKATADACAAMITAAVTQGLDAAPHTPQAYVVRLRGCFQQTATCTGRLAMSEPNLQTVPKPAEFDINGSQQVQLEESENAAPPLPPVSLNVRAAFVAPPGCVILSADYSQVELRLIAHLSEDKVLCGTLAKDGQDPFTAMACMWQKCPIDQVTPEKRDQAKHLAYGLLYGMGPHAVAAALSLPDVRTAAEWQESFLSSMPGVQDWVKRVKEDCKLTQHVTTIAGRRRNLPLINSKSHEARGSAERAAVNTVAQGSAADMMKTAMVRLHTILDSPKWAGAANLILMVHDELVYEVREERLVDVAALIKLEMERAMVLRVPTPVKLSMGLSWGTLESVTLEQLEVGFQNLAR